MSCNARGIAMREPGMLNHSVDGLELGRPPSQPRPLAIQDRRVTGRMEDEIAAVR